jgi:uncharacterized phage protein (TIGR01671 family)
MEKKREIKFRAFFSKPNGDGTMRYNISVGNKPIDDLDKFFEDTAKDGCIWMQYTGLLDKNGKEIYEGDLMTWEGVRRADGKPFVIEFSTELYGEQYGGGEDYFSGFSFPSQTKYGEVVGNIYENPELLSKV